MSPWKIVMMLLLALYMLCFFIAVLGELVSGKTIVGPMDGVTFLINFGLFVWGCCEKESK